MRFIYNPDANMAMRMLDIVYYAPGAVALHNELLAGGANAGSLVLVANDPLDLGYYVLDWTDSLGRAGRSCVVNGIWYEVRPLVTSFGPMNLLIPGPEVRGADNADVDLVIETVEEVPDVVVLD